jgi:hypothetical protein
MDIARQRFEKKVTPHRKWLKAGVMEDGPVVPGDRDTTGVIRSWRTCTCTR